MATCRECVGRAAPENGTLWAWCEAQGACTLWNSTGGGGGGGGQSPAGCGLVVVDGADNCPYDYGVPTILVIMQSFGGLCALLILGHLLRAHVRIFRWLYMPASLLAGLLGVTVLQLCYISPDVAYYMQGWTVGWGDLPGFLITFVFASLFMGLPIPSVAEVRAADPFSQARRAREINERGRGVAGMHARTQQIWRSAGPQLMYGQIVAWGLYAWPVLLTATVLVPFFGSNPLIAAIVGFGFEGGHGLAAGMSDSFESLGYPEVRIRDSGRERAGKGPGRERAETGPRQGRGRAGPRQG